MTQSKFRNAFAEAAHHRRNAGAQTHKNPPRQKVECYLCDDCGRPLHPGDESLLCQECEDAIVRDPRSAEEEEELAYELICHDAERRASWEETDGFNCIECGDELDPENPSAFCQACTDKLEVCPDCGGTGEHPCKEGIKCSCCHGLSVVSGQGNCNK